MNSRLPLEAIVILDKLAPAPQGAAVIGKEFESPHWAAAVILDEFAPRPKIRHRPAGTGWVT